MEAAPYETAFTVGSGFHPRPNKRMEILNLLTLVSFLVSATDDAVKAGAHAGDLAKEAAAICGGGSKPGMAQAGGKDPSKAEEALRTIAERAREMLGKG